MSEPEHRPAESGMYEFGLRMAPDEADPVIRALMRARSITRPFISMIPVTAMAVTPTDSSGHRLPQNARFSGIGGCHVLGETQNSELLIGVRSGQKVGMDPEKPIVWRPVASSRRRHP
jgi:hypothetical protein